MLGERRRPPSCSRRRNRALAIHNHIAFACFNTFLYCRHGTPEENGFLRRPHMAHEDRSTLSNQRSHLFAVVLVRNGPPRPSTTSHRSFFQPGSRPWRFPFCDTSFEGERRFVVRSRYGRARHHFGYIVGIEVGKMLLHKSNSLCVVCPIADAYLQSAEAFSGKRPAHAGRLG
jgi:hypothetical protein